MASVAETPWCKLDFEYSLRLSGLMKSSVKTNQSSHQITHSMFYKYSFKMNQYWAIRKISKTRVTRTTKNT